MFLRSGNLSLWKDLVVGATLHASVGSPVLPQGASISAALLFEPNKIGAYCPLTLDLRF